MRVAIAAIVLAVATDATAGLSVIRARGVAEPEPHVEAILLVTPNQLSPADYVLELDLAGADHGDKIVHGESFPTGDPLPLRLVFVVDGSAAFLAGANPSAEEGGSAAAGSGSAPPTKPSGREPALSFVEDALREFTTSFAGNAQFGVIVVDRNAVIVQELGAEPPAPHPLGATQDHAVDEFDVNAGLNAALELFKQLKAPHEDAIIIIGAPRGVLAPDTRTLLAQSKVAVFTLEVDTSSRDRTKWAALADDSRRLGSDKPAALPQLAQRLVKQLSSVVRVNFPVPPEAFDGSPHDLTFKLGPEHATERNVPFGPVRSTPGALHGLTWLLIGAVLLAAMLVIGVLMLIARRRREPHRHQVIRTQPLPPPPTGPSVPRHEDTETLAVPPPWFAAWFYVRDGSRRGEFLALKRAGTTTVGRSDRAHIKFDDTAVRSLHAKFNAQVGRVTIVALPEGETVRVGGQDVSRVELTDGMIIEFGSTKLLFKMTR